MSPRQAYSVGKVGKPHRVAKRSVLATAPGPMSSAPNRGRDKDHPVRRPTMTTPTSISIPKLRADVRGPVIGPDDAEYDRARAVFYGGFDLYPAGIVRVADEVDVARVIALARGIVIDLAGLRAIDVDAEERTAWAQTGQTALEFTTATHAHGLGVGFGDTG